MEELEAILHCHAARYEKMQPEDGVKLIYQNEFGGGHLIRDPESCLQYLCGEYDAIPKDPCAPLYEPIGNGLVRVNLAAVTPEQLEQLGARFIRSAAEHRGSMEGFLRKLQLLKKLTAQGVFSFDLPVLEEYLTEYTGKGCPMVSHSRQYRAAYHPAYRIVKG